MGVSAMLLLYCPDRQGIVTEITNFITVNNGNIIYTDQYVDRIDNVLFMRLEWELEGFIIPREQIKESINTLFGARFKMEFGLYFSDVKPRMALFVSRQNHCLFDILARYTAGEWDVEIPMVISNHEDLRPVAEDFRIPYYCFPLNKDNRNELEVEEMELMEREKINFIVLAKYMQIISPRMIERYPHNIINIHHSFLPAFVGARPYHQAFERGVKIIGATSHYVTEELDSGPIIEQDVIRISHKDTPETLIYKGKDLEKVVLSRAILKHIERKILTYKNKTVIFA